MHCSRFTVVLLALLAGCTIGPDYRRPAADIPKAWKGDPPRAADKAADEPPSPLLAKADAASGGAVEVGSRDLVDTRWWSAFGDPTLDRLIETAVTENKELRIAALRVEQADAYLQIRQADALPQVGYNGARTRDTLSQNRQVPLAVGTQPVGNNYQVAVAASWELDLWGKLARANEAAKAELLATEENRRALMLSVVAQVADTYLRLRELDRELVLLKGVAANYREAVRLEELRFEHGGSAQTAVTHAESAWLEAQAKVPAKEAEIAVLENMLSTLLGGAPRQIVRGKAITEMVLPKVPGGLPSDVLVQRPDVRSAEQSLIAANARIGVAKGQYLPSISLTAATGFASSDLNNLTLLSSNYGAFGVTLFGPLFTSGRIAGQVREAESQQQQAEIAYLRTMQTALREVEDALVTNRRVHDQAGFLTQQIAALTELVRQQRSRFDLGYSSYFDVLAAQRALLLAQQQESQSHLGQLTSLIAVYKAVGGGWALPDQTAPRAPQPTLDTTTGYE